MIELFIWIIVFFPVLWIGFIVSGSRILVQCGSSCESRELMTKNVVKIPIFWSKVTNYLSLGINEGRLSFKTWNFLTLFCFSGLILHSWIRIQPTKTNADPFGSVSTTLICVEVSVWVAPPLCRERICWIRTLTTKRLKGPCPAFWTSSAPCTMASSTRWDLVLKIKSL